MRRLLLGAAAVSAIMAAPAYARDGAGYVGIEGGIMWPKDNDGNIGVSYDETFSFSSTAATSDGAPYPLAADTFDEDAFGIEYDSGFDIDMVAGYDFGFIRAEVEIGYKRAEGNSEISQSLLDDINENILRDLPDIRGATRPIITQDDFDDDGRLDDTVKVYSAMFNLLGDFNVTEDIALYGGGGFGRARVKGFSDDDSAWAWQLIAGARFAVTDWLDLGVKYRYFQTGHVSLQDTVITYAGSQRPVTSTELCPSTALPSRTCNRQVIDATVASEMTDKFSSHSLLASLIFNFGGEAPPPRRRRRLRPAAAPAAACHADVPGRLGDPGD
ncbi:outer membrane beta-barrel protein [Sphingomonas sp. HDW15A]|uniref:outer membrane protein n=1 Tax=Sphingomonas sp. HDW15A TaxID=2714942 RepID=UPI0023F82BC4|nr:outer membrane beta-barrel protein [Sphingomonas sp. HDW15A]